MKVILISIGALIATFSIVYFDVPFLAYMAIWIGATLTSIGIWEHYK